MKYPDDHPFSPNYRSRLAASLASDPHRGKAHAPKPESRAGHHAAMSGLSKAQAKTKRTLVGATPGQRAGVDHLARGRKTKQEAAR